MFLWCLFDVLLLILVAASFFSISFIVFYLMLHSLRSMMLLRCFSEDALIFLYLWRFVDVPLKILLCFFWVSFIDAVWILFDISFPCIIFDAFLFFFHTSLMLLKSMFDAVVSFLCFFVAFSRSCHQCWLIRLINTADSYFFPQKVKDYNNVKNFQQNFCTKLLVRMELLCFSTKNIFFCSDKVSLHHQHLFLWLIDFKNHFLSITHISIIYSHGNITNLLIVRDNTFQETPVITTCDTYQCLYKLDSIKHI